MLDNGLVNVTYTDTECADEATTNTYAEKVTAFMKLMLQDYSNPYELANGSALKSTYFANRQTVGLLSTIA